MPDLREKLMKESIEAAKKDAEAKAAEKAAEEAAEKEAGEPEAEAEMEAERVEGVVEDATEAEAEDTEAAAETEEADEIPDEENDGEEAEGSEEEKKKFGFFKKDKKEKKDPRDEKIAELNDRLMRNLAEFENFRKRSEKEKSAMFEIGAKSIVEKILPALDSFDLGLAALSEEDKASGVGQGMEKIYKQLMTSLEAAGVTPIEALGKEFDPNLHNAVMHEDNEEFGENIVSQELQKGYMYHDSVVRHSMVKVAN